MHLSTIIFINGNRHLRGGVDDSSAPRRKVLSVGNVALEEVFILGVDLDAMRHHAWEAGDRGKAFRAVKFGPRMVDALDLIGDDFAGKDAQCEAVARVPSHDVGVAHALVEFNEGNQVDGIQNLTRLSIVDRASLCESFSNPGLQLRMPNVPFFLVHFVIATANDEIIVLIIASGEADVFLRVRLVVDEAVFDAGFLEYGLQCSVFDGTPSLKNVLIIE